MAPKTHPIDLIRGWPHPSLLPTQQLTASSRTVLADREIYGTALQYGDDPGYQPLREALATWVHEHYGVERDPERLCISGGASQNIARILSSYTDPNVTRAVWLAAPTYHLVCGIFDDAGFNGRLRAFPENDEGPDVQALETALGRHEEREPKRQTPVKDHGPHRKFYRHVIYVVPTCANPSGKTMPIQLREDLVRVARKYDALIICDDVYDFLQWPVDQYDPSERIALDISSEMKLPRLCDIDLAMGQSENDPRGFGHAVSNGSFSKLVGPGLRTGWLEGARAFAFGLAQTGSTKSGGSPSQFSAAVITDMLMSGTLQEHLTAVVRPALQHRHRVMVDSVQRHLVPLGVTLRRTGLTHGSVYGGYFVWLTLPEGLSSTEVTTLCRKEGLDVGNGTMFQVHGDEDAIDLDSHLRLTFSYVPEEDLDAGISRLASVMRRMI